MGGISGWVGDHGSGAAVGGAILGPAGAIGGGALGNSGWERATGQTGAREKRKSYNESVAKQRQEQEGVLGQMKSNDSDYYNRQKGSISDFKNTQNAIAKPYLGKVEQYRDQAERQGHDASVAYTNTIEPNLKNVMEDSKRDIGTAYAQTTGRYNEEGERVRSMGLQDAGVMSALGAQATSQQFGATPGLMTGGQMAAISGANQSQSQQAYARAQDQMMRLREQGVGSGINQENIAKDRYSNSIGAYQSGLDDNVSRQQALRGESSGFNDKAFGTREGIAQQNFGLDQGLSSLQYGQAQNQANAQMGVINGNYGANQQGIAGAMQADAAKTQAWQSGLFGVAGAAAGGAAGGASGAGAGAAATRGAAPPPAASAPAAGGQNVDYADGSAAGYSAGTQAGYQNGYQGAYGYQPPQRQQRPAYNGPMRSSY